MHLYDWPGAQPRDASGPCKSFSSLRAFIIDTTPPSLSSWKTTTPYCLTPPPLRHLFRQCCPPSLPLQPLPHQQHLLRPHPHSSLYPPSVIVKLLEKTTSVGNHHTTTTTLSSVHVCKRETIHRHHHCPVRSHHQHQFEEEDLIWVLQRPPRSCICILEGTTSTA